MGIKWVGDDLFQIATDISDQKEEDNLALIAKYQEYHSSEQQQEKYVLRGSILKCNKGSGLSTLDMPSDHGIEPPVTLASDSAINVNVHSFGTCSCRKGSNDTQCNPVLCNGWLQAENGTLMIWNEITQKYEAAVKESAVLTCSYGGLITVEEVPQKELKKVSKLLLCMHGKNFAIVDTLHSTADQILSESIFLADIEEMEMEMDMGMTASKSMFSAYGSADKSDRDIEAEIENPINANKVRDETAEEIAKEEDSIEKQKIAVEYILEGADYYREEGVLPEHNNLTLLVENYLRQGGDIPGLCIGWVWLRGQSPDASQETIDFFREKKVIEKNETIGEIELGTNNYFLYLLKGLLDDEMVLNINWQNYMEENPILLGKVGDVVIPMGTNLEKGKSRKINRLSDDEKVIEDGIVNVPAGEKLFISIDATARDSSKALTSRSGPSVKIVNLD